ncbi:metallophosphoesterase [Bradyrhizobium erythrophlei]|uniref:Calcineurin-like phosphoesterase superfamily protein n=1 Tax=Bradyrhizobium erythrophlei TaxID=1437360 RepID=A0A1M5TA12_9BRAD|nr:metallophosphoesterase [Bradyrhizobium erythrophlei]SHH47541.1 Calcineurin-like phosphoesterase superfamily protein [Bradyrhizobium erythrophlei]
MIFFTSDSHYFHQNILRFTGQDGQRVRPEFNSVEEMNEAMVTRWNEVVHPGDKVYHLGDVAFGPTANAVAIHALLRRLNGRKRLIVGNHDNLKSEALQNNFDKILLWQGFHDEGFTCSHIPLRLDSLRDGSFNVHGHIHERTMAERNYINVCVEQTNYTPVSMDWVKEQIRQRS